jgi:hypothetical protein
VVLKCCGESHRTKIDCIIGSEQRGVMAFLVTKCRKMHIMWLTARADAPYVSVYAAANEVVEATLLSV